MQKQAKRDICSMLQSSNSVEKAPVHLQAKCALEAWANMQNMRYMLKKRHCSAKGYLQHAAKQQVRRKSATAVHLQAKCALEAWANMQNMRYMLKKRHSDAQRNDAQVRLLTRH